MLGTAVILPVWRTGSGAVFDADLFENHCVPKLPNSPGLRGLSVSRLLKRPLMMRASWCSSNNSKSFDHTLTRPLLEEEMKGPPLLVVGETQLPSIGGRLLKHTSRLFARLAPTSTPLVVAACNQLQNWILLVNIHLDIGFSLPNNIPPTTVSFTCFLYESNLIPQS